MSETAIRADGLTVMQSGQRVLDNVSFGLDRASSLAIAGRNGTGKTLLLRTIAGLEPVSEGRLTINGLTAGALNERAWIELRRHIGLVLENSALLHDLTLAENLAFPLVRSRMPEDEIEARLEHSLVEFDLDPWRNAAVSSLSASIVKRALLARALITLPGILLFDSPFEGLDPGAEAELKENLKRLVAKQKVALLVTGHDPARIKDFADTTLVLERGSLAPLR